MLALPSVVYLWCAKSERLWPPLRHAASLFRHLKLLVVLIRFLVSHTNLNIVQTHQHPPISRFHGLSSEGNKHLASNRWEQILKSKLISNAITTQVGNIVLEGGRTGCCIGGCYRSFFEVPGPAQGVAFCAARNTTACWYCSMGMVLAK